MSRFLDMKVLQIRKIVFGFSHIPCISTVLDHLFGVRLSALEMCYVLVQLSVPSTVVVNEFDELPQDCFVVLMFVCAPLYVPFSRLHTLWHHIVP